MLSLEDDLQAKPAEPQMPPGLQQQTKLAGDSKCLSYNNNTSILQG